jgi:hypothetical protein
VPKDIGTKELIRTVTTNGGTERAYASLKSDSQIDKQTIVVVGLQRKYQCPASTNPSPSVSKPATGLRVH